MSVIALLCAVTSMDANALALGRITVLSVLGEPLRAEIELAEINADEAASLQTKVASPGAFKAAGIEFTSVLSGMSISLQQRADGRSYLRLVGNRAVSEPFVDLIVEANWSAGRISRDYTMLFDPPGLRSSATVAQSVQTIPMVPRTNMPNLPPAVTQTPLAPPQAPLARAPAPLAPRPPPVAVARETASLRTPAVRAPAVSGASAKEFTVRAGDTASKIAAQTKNSNVSLDQMLVALLQQNPDAFIAGNINRVKSGAVLQIPSQETVAALPAAQATQIIVAQSANFNVFRRNLAGNVPTAATVNAGRQAGGKLQTRVEDRAPASTVPDKLTLSKEAVPGKLATSAEQQIATERQASNSASRIADLSKNISDLNKLSAASTAAAAAASGLRTPASGVPVLIPATVAVQPPAAKPLAPVSVLTSSAAPILVVSAPAAVIGAAVPAASKSASAAMVALQPSSATMPAASKSAGAAMVTLQPSSAAVPAAPENAGTAMAALQPSSTAIGATTPTSIPMLSPASAPIQTASAASNIAALPLSSASAVLIPAASVPAPKNVPATNAGKPSLLEELMNNPLILTGLALLVALLGGFAFYRNRQRKKSTQVDSSFLESRLQPDSFFGASGGQRVDTKDGRATGSSSVYSPSQLDTAGDVDPVAEADVYLAYGRDLQAEEILKEALRITPMRVAIHAKLLEIYAKRRDVKAFGVIATEAFKLTRGEGTEWRYITEMGRELDPGNIMYLPGGQPLAKPAAVAQAASGPASGFGSNTQSPAIESQVPGTANIVDFDLDLDFLTAGENAGKPSLAEMPNISAAPVSKPFVAPMVTPSTPMFEDFSMDFTGNETVSPAASFVVKTPAVDKPLSFDSITFSDESDFKKPSLAPLAQPVASVASNTPLEFDMSDLSLDLNGPITEITPHLGNAVLEDPLETKLSLAQEFSSLGDPEGARAMAEEVLLEAKGPLKIKAQAFLNALL